jgi:DNA-binding GntR family transcriptional regulator
LVATELTRLQTERLTDTIYRLLRERILNGTYQPGEKLPVDQIAQQLEVSQTPVKGALNQLAAEGLVWLSPRRGTFVAELSARAIVESLSIRAALEQLAAETLIDHVEAAELERLTAIARQIEQAPDVYEHFRLNMQFHQELVELSGNQRLAEIYRNLKAHIQMALVHSLSASWTDRMPTEAAEHEAILEAIAAKDQAALRGAIRAHLANARTSLLRQLEWKLSADELASVGAR